MRAVLGSRGIAALVAVLLVAGVGRSAAGLEARIDAVIPGDRVFYPGQDVKVRLVFRLDPATSLKEPVAEYEIVRYERSAGGEVAAARVVASGSTRFNQVIASGGWAEFAPELPEGDGAAWYRLDVSLRDAEGPVPIAGWDGGRARLSFGIVPPSPDPGAWGAPRGEAASPSRKVLAFYYNWYGSPSVSGSWVHWPEGGHNPNASDESGLPDIGAAHHPALGPYDSNDPRVIKQHLAWAEAAGIDALIATWWGQGEYSDRALLPLLDAAAGTPVRVSVYYETVPANSEARALQDFRYILSRYGDHPAFFKHEGEPVIFVYGRAMGQLPFEAWRRVIETVKAEYGAKFIADSADARWAEIFDGLHLYNPVGQVVGGADMRRVYDAAVRAARLHGKIASATVIPGYDDSNIGRQAVIVAPRRDGALYDELWELAIESRPEWIVITSFNEWHEGSEIEPSVEYGELFLRSTAAWAARFKSASEPTLWVQRSSLPAVAQPGGEYLVWFDVTLTEGEGAPSVRWSLPEGWSVQEGRRDNGGGGDGPGEVAADTGPSGAAAAGRTGSDGEGEPSSMIAARLTVPEGAEPGTYTVAATLAWQGYETEHRARVTVAAAGEAPFEGAGVWTELGPVNRELGLVQRDHPDGMTAPAEIDGRAARSTARGVTANKYVYFDVADQFLFDAGGAEVEIGIEYLDRGLGVIQLQYDSTNPAGGPFEGAYTNGPTFSLRNSGEWRTAVLRVRDARFANRQNGGTDFRFAVGTGDLVMRMVYVKLVD